MKSTYKLFGIFWDGKESEECLYPTLDSIEDDHSDDIILSFKKLLSVQDEGGFSALVPPDAENRSVLVTMDYWTDHPNPALIAFLEKRRRQIFSCLAHHFRNVYSIKV
jgi:hypothetical protein